MPIKPTDEKLLFACRSGNVDWAAAALDAGVDPDLCNHEGVPALQLAASHGHGEICTKLLEGGANLGAREAAAEAAEDAGHAKVAAALRAWAPVGEFTGLPLWDREWALVKAAQRDDLREVEALLAAGVDPDAASQPDMPMSSAARWGSDTEKLASSRVGDPPREPERDQGCWVSG
jgi:uncharacterized protein